MRISPGRSSSFAVLSLFLLFVLACSASEPEKIFHQGEEAWYEGQYSLAMEDFERLVELYPEHDLADDAMMWLGDIQYLFMSRYDEAIMYYRELVNTYPESDRMIEARMKMAGIYRGKKNDCKMAVIEYEKVILENVPPETAAEAQYQIAMCHFQESNIQQAITEFEILVSDYPGSDLADDALYGLASSYYAQRRCPEAVSLYQRVADTSPDTNLVLDSRFGIGACHEETGRLQEALVIMKNLLDEHPNRRMVEHRLKRIESRIKKLGDKRIGVPGEPAAEGG
jgi:TolA-binding protein